MPSFNRYLFRQLLVATLFVTLAITAAIWLIQSLRLVDYMVNRGLPVSQFLKLTMLLLPGFLGVVLPIGTAIAVVWIYQKLILDSELVVMRSSGVSQLQLARPAFVLCLLATAVVYSITLYFLPLSYRTFKDLQVDYRNNYASVLIQEGVFNPLGKDVTVYVRQRDAEGSLVGIIVDDRRDRNRLATVVAERGAILRTDGGARVYLVNGNRQELDQRNGQYSMLYFDQYTVELNILPQSIPTRARQPAERSVSELLNPTEVELQDETLIREFRAELHARLVTPLYTITFTLIGLASLLTGDFDRRGRPIPLAVATVAVAVLEGISLVSEDLANRAQDAAGLMYAVPLVPALICVYLLARRRSSPRRRPLVALIGAET